jgi:uncharacterized protein YdeI (YjbR/CyaY-like superfamily)
MSAKLIPTDVTFFESPAKFRAWLKANHAIADEKWVGFRPKASGLPSLTWEQSVDEALCFGWIDGIRKGVDGGSAIRFTPRRPGSNWSARNVARVAELTKAGRMAPAGLRAFEGRKAAKSGTYSYENAPRDFEGEERKALQADPDAWSFWQAAPAGYRRIATWWVFSAKRQETRDRRLAQLIEESAAGRRIDQLTPPDRRSG